MDELKTLKELYDLNDFVAGVNNIKSQDYIGTIELRNEATKWVKELEKERYRQHNEDKPQTGLISFKMQKDGQISLNWIKNEQANLDTQTALIDWINHFFNLR